MKKSTTTLRLALTALTTIVLLDCDLQRARAGWTGTMDGTGKGWVSVNVRSSRGTSRTISTLGSFPANTLNPSAAMAPLSGYLTNAPLPSGSSSGTVARVKGSPGYVWTATTSGSNGDGTDNEEVEARVNIVPSDCAFLAMDSTAELSSNGISGTITVNATATAGTALLLRGFEYPGNLPPPQSTEDLMANGSVKWDILLVGPFDLRNQDNNCNALVIPFNLPTGDTNLYFVTDGVAKSKPMIITCPENVVYGCADQVVYPVPEVIGGCGPITLTYDPPADALPVGVVSTVTVTADDGNGATASCTFQADNTAKGIPLVITCPTNVCFDCSDVVAYPSAQVSGGCGAVTVSYNPPASALPVGTSTVTVTAQDSLGRTAQCSFIAIRKSLAFDGFYSPISGTGGTCGSPLRRINLGSNIPVKFKVKCSGSTVVSGRPTLSIQQCSGGAYSGGGNFKLVGNEWHFNWDTTGAGIKRGSYQLTATLQDGSKKSVYLELK